VLPVLLVCIVDTCGSGDDVDGGFGGAEVLLVLPVDAGGDGTFVLLLDVFLELVLVRSDTLVLRIAHIRIGFPSVEKGEETHV
jgi:hypothetical protein